MRALTVGFFVGIAAAAGSAGCGQVLPSVLTPGGSSQYFDLTTPDKVARRYKIYIPSQYSSNVPAPLILSFHGAGQTGAGQESTTRFSDKIVNPNSIIAYPDGINVSLTVATLLSMESSTNVIPGLLARRTLRHCRRG